MRPRLLPALLLLAAAAAPAARADEGKKPDAPPEDEAPAAAPVPPPPPAHPTWDDREGPLMEFRGGVEAGFRFLGGDEGRYDQDLRLGRGFALLSADLEGTSVRDGVGLDSVALHARGFGDADRRIDLRARAQDAWDLSLHADRLAYAFVAAGLPHAYDTVREGDGGSLRLRPWKCLEVFASTERVHRFGDALLDQKYWEDRAFPLPATVDADTRVDTGGFDARTGAFRFGGTASWTGTTDDSFRLLRRPDSPVDDHGPFRNRSDADSRTLEGRAGARLWKGALDLSASGGYATGGTDSQVKERVVTVTAGSDRIFGTGDDLVWSSETHGTTSADLRSRWWRAEALVAPADAWEALARYEQRATDERGRYDLFLRDQTPPFGDPSLPFFHDRKAPTADARLERFGLEGRWRAAREWRFRGGIEEVTERVAEMKARRFVYRPQTRVVTAGTDWKPSDRFDASLLARAADQRDDATQLSPGEAEGLSLRLRGRDPSGWHSTGYARVKARHGDAPDAVGRADAYGVVLGHESAEGSFEVTAERRRFDFATDTQFVVDLSGGGVKGPHRVSFYEDSESLALDASRRISGPLRAFTRSWWDRASGDSPWRRYDASLGLGWRFVPSTEIRLEVRRAVLNETGRGVDDYRADIVTLSVLWEF